MWAFRSVIRRLPIMISPIFGGMLIDHFGIIAGVRIALIVSIFLSAFTILVQRQLREHSNDRTRDVAATAVQRSAGVLAKLARIQSADATFAVKRYPDAFLRTSSLCLGRNFCDGLHRRERSASWRSHDNRDARSHVVHHSHLTLSPINIGASHLLS